MKIAPQYRFTPSPAVRRLKPSATLSINERVKALWEQGKDVLHLGFGESRFPIHPAIAAALQAHTGEKSYAPSQGILPLREQVAMFYGRHFGLEVTPDRIIVGPGSKSLIYALQQALDGDLVLPYPSWVSYAPQAHLLGKRVVWIRTRLEDGYILAVDALAEGLDKVRQAGLNPRLLLINSPNNPTGTMYPEASVAAIADLAREQDLTLISDEIYALVAHCRQEHVSFARYYPEGTVVLGSLSKHLSLGGWRLGMAVVPPGPAGAHLIRTLVSIASETWSAVATPIQYAAVTAYSEDPDIAAYIRTCAQVHGAMARYLHQALSVAGIPCAPPAGAFYLYPNFDAWRAPLSRRGVHTSEDLAAHLLEEHHIATLPGTAFGGEPSDLSLRLSTSFVDAPTDEEAKALLEAYCGQPDEAQFVAAACPRLMRVGTLFQELVAAWQRGHHL